MQSDRIKSIWLLLKKIVEICCLYCLKSKVAFT